MKNASTSMDMYRSDAWHRIRGHMLKHWPQCCRCGARAKVVDHVIPHKGNVALFYDARNLVTMCAACHNRKTVQHDGGFGNATSAAPAVARVKPTVVHSQQSDDEGDEFVFA